MMFLESEMKTNGLVESAVHKLFVLHIFEVRSPSRGLKFTHKLSHLLNAADESITASCTSKETSCQPFTS
jgi:hypothetical protein